MITRDFEIDDWHVRSSDDGRTVEGRIVPYNEPTDVVERTESGDLIRYREQFLPHSCLAMAQAVAKRGNAAFIALLMDHEERDFNAKIGYASTLESRDDGAHAVFRLYQSRDLEKVVSMLDESHKGLSVAFRDTKQPRDVDGVVSRVQVQIDHVAATPTPCYVGAGITGVRSEDMEALLIATPALDEIKQWLDANRKVVA
jgi:phage head maturation protease